MNMGLYKCFISENCTQYVYMLMYIHASAVGTYKIQSYTKINK